MRKVLLPVAEDRPSNLPEHIYNDIYITPGAEIKKNLVLLCQGSGAVRAGMWARALCMNDSLKTGAIFEYLKN